MRAEETTQTVSCDRCKMSVRSIDRPKFYPEEWKVVGDLDLCPKCADDFRHFMRWPELMAEATR